MKKQLLGAVGKQAVVGAYLCTLPGIGPGFGNDKDNNIIVGTSSQPLRPVAPSPTAPLLKGSSLFSRMSLASVPSSIRSSLVMTPMVRRPERAQRSEDAMREGPGPAACRVPHFQAVRPGTSHNVTSLDPSFSHTNLRGLSMKINWLVTNVQSGNTGHHHCHSCDLPTVSCCHGVRGRPHGNSNPGSVSMLR